MAAAGHRGVRLEMRPEGGKTVRRARLSGGEGGDTIRHVIVAEAYPCEVLVGIGPCWGAVVAAAGSFEEPVVPSEGKGKIEAKTVFAVYQHSSRQGRRPKVSTKADTRATNV